MTVANREEMLRSPLKTIRARCLDCVAGSRAEVRRCELRECPLWPYRMGRRPKAWPEGMPRWTPARAIRAECLDCCVGSAYEVRLCAATNCPCHPWRFGRRPQQERTRGTPAHVFTPRCTRQFERRHRGGGLATSFPQERARGSGRRDSEGSLIEENSIHDPKD